MRELTTELGAGALGREPSERWSRMQANAWASPGAEEELIAELRLALARLALATAGEDEAGGRAVEAALDGAEVVARNELALRRIDGVATHLPGFVFMVSLPHLGRRRSLELAERAREKIEAAA